MRGTIHRRLARLEGMYGVDRPVELCGLVTTQAAIFEVLLVVDGRTRGLPNQEKDLHHAKPESPNRAT